MLTKKKGLALVLTAILAAATVSGCVPTATTPTATPSTAAPKGSGTSDTAPATATDSNFNKTGFPIVNEPVTYTIAATSKRNKEFEELEYFIELEKLTNVDIQWNMSSGEGWPEKKSLLFASGDLPDAFYGAKIITDAEIVKYAAQDVFIPLGDMVKEYCPNFTHVLDTEPKFLAQITAPDGGIYTLPAITQLDPVTYSKFFMNKTWLDQLGLAVPQTLEEFQAALQAFKDNDMNGNGSNTDEIPFTFRAKDIAQQNLTPLFGSFGQLDDSSHFIVKDGKAVYTAMTDPYKEGIKYFHTLYSNGLIDKEGFTHDPNVYISKIQDPAKICGGFMGWSRNSTAGPNKDDFVPVAPLKSAEGKQIWMPVDSQIVSKGSFAITNTAKNPEILMRWIDVGYEQERSLEINQGLLGKHLEKTPEGNYRYLPLPEGKLADEQIHDYSPGNNGVFAVLHEIGDKLELNANLKERAELDEFYKPYNIPMDEVYPKVLFDMNEIDRFSVLKTDIDAYAEKCYAGWIADGTIDQEWDGYLKKLEDMHVQEYIQIHQQALDRYNKSMKEVQG